MVIEICANPVRKWDGGGGYLRNHLTYRNGSPIKICRILQVKAWESFQDCISIAIDNKLHVSANFRFGQLEPWYPILKLGSLVLRSKLINVNKNVNNTRWLKLKKISQNNSCVSCIHSIFAYMFDHYIKEIVFAKNKWMRITIFQLNGPRQITMESC